MQNVGVRLAAIFLAAASNLSFSFSVLADHVSSNTGVACVKYEDVKLLADKSLVGDRKGWSDLALAMTSDGRCQLLLRGTNVNLKQAFAEPGITSISLVGNTSQLWIEAANVTAGDPLVEPPTPPRSGDRRKVATGTVYGCVDRNSIVLDRKLQKEGDKDAAKRLIAEGIVNGRCRIFEVGSELIWREKHNDDLALVRIVGFPEEYWIDQAWYDYQERATAISEK